MEAVRVTDEALLERIRTHKKVLPYITQQQSSNVDGHFHLDHERHDKNQRKYEDKLLAHLGHTTMLSSEIEQQYGFRAPHVVLDNYVGNTSNREKSQIIDDILRTRQQQYLDKLNTTTTEFRHLLTQREQIENETDKVEQMKRLITTDRAPITGSATDRVFSEPPPEDIIVPYGGRGASQSVTSFIKLTNDRLPAEIEKYKRLRDNVEQRYFKLYRPYDGHLGPQSYKSWQLADYHMVHSIVDELVERFLDNYFWKTPSYHDTETTYSVSQAETQKWGSQRRAIIQGTAIQLIMEEIVLQVTRKLAEDTAEEFFALYKFIYNRSDTMFTKTAQSVAKGEAYEDVRMYNQVTNMFHTLQHERDRDRLTVFSHSQQVDSKRTPQNNQQ